jgi:hypothetical protein
MIRKSVKRFSEKIMLKQRENRGVPQPATTLGLALVGSKAG